MATTHSHARLSISALGWSFSATLVVLFVLCMVAAFFVSLRLAHGWANLLSDAPTNSSRIWVKGLIANFWHHLQLDCRAACATRDALSGVDP